MIQQNVSLQPFNTFGLAAQAAYFATFDSIEQLQHLLQSPIAKQHQVAVLGGGSNILLTQAKQELVLKNQIKGIALVAEDENYYYVESGGGVAWHEFVMWCVEHNYQGVENLSLIPGTVGAAPMQNIGAYGVEIKDVFENLLAIAIEDGSQQIFKHADCQFGYRESVFKHQYKNKFVIASVTFKLNKIANINTSYGAIEQVLSSKNITSPSIKDVSNAVIEIRQSKLPDPKVIGNAGSFFKNPEIAKEQFTQLKKVNETMPAYVVNEQRMKVPAGWLIEQCGWKGFREKNYGVHALQALVLVNFGGADGNDLYRLSTQIIESVKNKFDIVLEREVNIW
jgi:UDP-N-acetylmuramate dehydrogenase